MITATAIATIIESITRLTIALSDSQTAEQRKIMWDRYIELTEPFHRMLVKLMNAGQENT